MPPFPNCHSVREKTNSFLGQFFFLDVCDYIEMWLVLKSFWNKVRFK